MKFVSPFSVASASLCLICSVSTLLSLAHRTMKLIGLGDLLEDDSQKAEYMLEGRSLINREKRKRQRQVADGHVSSVCRVVVGLARIVVKSLCSLTVYFG